MPLSVQGYAAQSAETPLGPFQFARRDLRPTDLEISIKYCGVCHSDLHLARNDWGSSRYPIVPGHEIIGQVTHVGAEVSGFSLGEWVGVGCLVDSCRHCEACAEGLEQYCENIPTFTYNSIDRHDGLPTYGGYSDRIVVDREFVLHLPEGLEPSSAAPLLCAGITTYSPLRHWKIGPGHKVAVVGLGGLGHMALKFAKALGADVTLFTRSPGKEEEARRLGAGHVVISTDAEQMKVAAKSFDFILDTVPQEHDINPYVATLKRDGTLCLVGLLGPIDPPANSRSLVTARRSVSGSLIGGLPETQEMLNFCAEKGVTCDVEMIPIQAINEAYERMLRSDVRYRFVIVIASLGKT